MKLKQSKQSIEAMDCDLANSSFTDVSFSCATFEDVNFSDANINNANMSGLHIRNADMSRVSIAQSQTEGMTIDGIAVSDLMAAYKASAK